MLKYLRIAVTAVSLTACVLLIALWVRSSYWWMDDVSLILFKDTAGVSQMLILRSWSSVVVFHTRPYHGAVPYRSRVSSEYAPYDPSDAVYSSVLNKRWQLSYDWGGSELQVHCPHWLIIAIFAIVAAAPWVPRLRRFSLRTLLIATTLVAVVLGVIISTS